VKKINLASKIIKNKNIILKPISIDHYMHFYKHSSNKKIFKYMEYQSFNKKKTLEYLKNIIYQSKSSQFQTWAIFFNLKFVGTITLRVKKKIKPYVEIAYAISAPFWGKGIFLNSVKILIRYLKKRNIQSVYASVRVDNFASFIGLVKIGFRIESIFKTKLKKKNKCYNTFLLKKKIK
jgi:RimJ/RimL family protein N-acetyltransferase